MYTCIQHVGISLGTYMFLLRKQEKRRGMDRLRTLQKEVSTKVKANVIVERQISKLHSNGVKVKKGVDFAQLRAVK